MDRSIDEEPAKWRAKRKLPFRQVSFGLEQLIENGIAHHMKQLEDVLLDLQSCHEANSVQTTREKVRHVLILLTQDLRQMEEMKSSVKDEDISKFEKSAESSRRKVHEAIQKAKMVVAADASRDLSRIPTVQDEVHADSDSISKETTAFQQSMLIQDNENLFKTAQDVESIAQDMLDLKEMMNVLNQNIADQGEALEGIEHHVEEATANIGRGEVLLAQARHLKTAALPIVGLTVGFVAGGPIGAIAGVRIGFATSMIGGAIGYAGGKVLHRLNTFTSIVPRVEAPPLLGAVSSEETHDNSIVQIKKQN